MKAMCVFILGLVISSLAFAQSKVPSNFWGIQVNMLSSQYPQNSPGLPSFQTVRLWDTATSWSDIETSQGHYDFSHFEKWMNKFNNAYGTLSFDVIYTFGKTPAFYVSDTQHNCGSAPAGSCLPPQELQCIGGLTAGTGGTDNHLIAFATALWSEIHNKGWDVNHNWYFETWNEPDQQNFWDSGYITSMICPGSQSSPRRLLARMSADIRSAIGNPTGKVYFLNPPPSNIGTEAASSGWWYNYLSGDGGQWGVTVPCHGYSGNLPCGGGALADIISVHGYLLADNNESPDDIAAEVVTARQDMTSFGQGPKQLFMTEDSWNNYCDKYNKCGTSTQPNDLPTAYVGRYYTLLASTAQSGVDLFAWYNWDSFGQFFCPPGGAPNYVCNKPTQLGLSTTGVALTEMQTNWGYVNATFTGCQNLFQQGCSQSFTACSLTKGNGKAALAVWYDTWSNLSDTCQFTPSPQNWADYRDLEGDPPTPYSGGAVTIGAEPILFEAP